jgi:hypothetical protein
MRDGREVHPFVQIVHYGSVWAPSKEVEDAIVTAVMQPALAKVKPVAPPLVPYLVTADHIARRDALLAANGQKPEGAAGLLPLAPNVYLTVAADTPEGVSPLFLADLTQRGVALLDVLPEARRNLEARLGSEALPVHTYSVTPWAIPPIWRPGMHAVVNGTDTTKVLVVGPSWMAAGAAATGALFRRAAQELGTENLRVLVPHRDRVFVFPESEDEAVNKTFADGVLRAEADGAKPISDWQFVLDTCGVTPVGRRALEWILFTARKGATRAEVEASVPGDTTWTWAEGERGAPDRLWGECLRTPPFRIAFEFAARGLRAVRVMASAVGDYGVLADLDAKLRQSLPDVAFTFGKEPWEVEKARRIIENKGNEQMKMATPINAYVPGWGPLIGKVFGCKIQGQQAYGFEVTYLPGESDVSGPLPR